MASKISTIICKPTRECNADCSYCSSPPVSGDANAHWSFEQFKTAFDRLKPRLDAKPVWIWHGGEPMLLGPKFYEECWAYARDSHPGIKFSIQTNILLYSNRWKPIFRDIMKGSLSTSYDPDNTYRTIKGNVDAYTIKFYEKLSRITSDGFRPMVVSTYDDDTIHIAEELYDKSLGMGDESFHIRFNYRYPMGRADNEGKGLLDPVTYGEMLIKLFNKWMDDVPNFSITPLDQMLDLVVGGQNERCPWTRGCNGRFVGIEPNGDLYNCADFADFQDERYRFGNVFDGTVTTKVINLVKKVDTDYINAALRTPASMSHARRKFDLPRDCLSCDQYRECQGGCMRDSVLYNRGMGGKFFYCDSWKMVFKHIKESVVSGKADDLLTLLGYDIDTAHRFVKDNNRV
ncbi:radical SAM protein [Vibrio splendidus]